MAIKIELVAGVSEIQKMSMLEVCFITNHMIVENGHLLTEEQFSELIKIGLMAMKTYLDKLGTPMEDEIKEKIKKSIFN